MIDINLLGKIQKLKPEKTSSTGGSNRTKIGILGGVAVLLMGLFWIFGDALVGMFYSTEPPGTSIQQARLDSLNRVLTERRLAPEPEPAVEEVPEPSPVSSSWDYRLSMAHIDAFTTFVQTLPITSDYNVIVVGKSGIIAELTVANEAEFFELQSAISGALLEYTFDFRPSGYILQVWGNRKADVPFSDVSPSPDFLTPEANLSALTTISQENSITIKERGKTSSINRNNVSLLPIRIKIQGAENNILRYLNSISNKRLNLNITKISGSGLNRSQGNNSSVLNFHFELLM
jgi:hypothetical protein